MKKGILGILFLMVFIMVSGTERPTEIKLGHEDKDAYPWVMPDGKSGYKGVDLEIIKLLEKELGIKIVTAAYPWQRCLEEMKVGKLDGVFAASYKADREVYGKYPKNAEGKEDGNKRIHTSGYSLYFVKGKNITFDGKTFSGLSGKVGAQRGFSIIKPLQDMGIEIDDGTADPEAILKKVMVGRNTAGALQTARADNLIENNEEFKNKIEKFSTNKSPLDQKPYFLMLSHQITEKYPEFAKEFWNALEKVVNSKEFKEKETEFYKNN